MFAKEFEIFKIGILNKVVYRFDTLIWALSMPLFFLVYYFLWHAVFSYTGQELIRGFTLNSMLLYFLISTAVGTLTYCFVDEKLAEDVRRGTLAPQLMRPISYLKYQFLQDVGDRVFASTAELVPMLIIALFLIDITFPSLLYFGLFVCSLILTLLLVYFFTYFFGLITFWVKQYRGLRRIRDGIAWVLSGAAMPLALFPPAIITISHFLPFQYMRYVPVQIFLEHYTLSETFRLILIQFTWVIIFYLLIRLVWARALKTYSGVGI